MPSRPCLCALALLLATSALAATTQLPLDPARPDAPATAATVTRSGPDGIDLSLELGRLEYETVTLADRQWTALSLVDGSQEGEPGRAELPVWTTLVVVPDGATVTATATAGERREFHGLDLQPWQPVQPGTAQPVVDTTWYAGGGRSERDLVTVGAPARMGGVTVVPVTVRPVSYDAGARTVTAAGRVDVSLDFAGGHPADLTRIAPAMGRVLADAALNWPDGRFAGDDNYGTWVAIIPAISTVRDAIMPLVNWRRQQGYHVIVADLNETGPDTHDILAYLQNLYDTLNVPLECVTLVGDANGTIAVPTWREDATGYHGEGDHYYTLLDGNDMLPDVFVGRLSCRYYSELDGIIAKIVAYETDPPRENTDWYTRGLVVGDPEDSGITTVFCARWLAEQLYGIDYERVYTVFAGDFTQQMIDNINLGRTVFGYRGFYGMSGFNSGHATILTNGGMLPFSIFPTCDTGSFLTDTTCRSEAFLRNANGGAIGAVGTATLGTHTRYNNCFFYGTFEGLINGTDHRQGAALARSRLELWHNYWTTEPHVVEGWSNWNSLMGDPATDIWLGVPQELDVTYPAALPQAATTVPVTVLSGGVPVAGAHVAATQDDTWRSVGLTDADGRVLLHLDGADTGFTRLTVSSHNLLPHRGSLTVADQDHWVALEGFSIDGDGAANPAEDLAIDLTLRNLGQQPATGVMATVTSLSPWLAVTDGTAAFGDLAAGATGTGDAPITVAVAPDTPDGALCRLNVAVTADTGSWESLLELTIAGSDLILDDLSFSAGQLAPGTSTEMVATVANTGTLPTAGAQAVLRSRSLWVTITDSLGTYGAIPVGGTAGNGAAPFAITFAADMVRGASVPLTLVLEETDGAVRRIDLNVPVGQRTETDPCGPDQYGYFAFDDGDTGYAETHAYIWVEIDPDYGGPGEDLALGDWSYELDKITTVDLPFPFTFYGETHTQLSICSNGWVAFGEEDIPYWRNWNLPSAGCPDEMIAVFWDDLRRVGDGGIYHWYDAAQHRYVVEWSRMRNYLYEGQQTCQVILYDPEHHPTLSQDGIIVCQYLELNDNDAARGYATLGIQGRNGTDGLTYSYYRQAAPGAATPQAGMAITYVPKGRREPVTCEVSPATIELTVLPNGQAQRTLHVANEGEPGTPLVYEIVQVDPSVTRTGAKDLTGSTAIIDATGYLPGEPLTVTVTVYNGSPDNEWLESFLVELPAGVNLIGGTDLFDGTHSLFWQDNAGDGADAWWLGQGADMINQYETAVGTFTIEVDYGVGDLELPWTLNGDVYGQPPHELTGTFTLVCEGSLLNLLAPDGGDYWSLGEQRQITWEHSDDITDVRIELTRDDGATWETLTDGVPAADGAFPWTVTGRVSGQCRVRISQVDNALVADTSQALFTIQNDLSWLAVTPVAGEIVAGNTAAHTLHFDATGLDEGDHEQVLLFVNNAGQDVTVPVTLTVDTSADAESLPRATTLAQNHPNPFNPHTRIDFALARDGRVDLAVFDLTGRRVARLVAGDLNAGRHTVLWDGRGAGGRALPSGTYLYRLVAGGEAFSRKLTLVK